MNDIMQMRFGGRCDRHPLNILPCEKCAAEAKAAPRDMTPAEVRKMLDDMADTAGSQKNLAAQLDVSESYLSDVLTGRREPGEKLLEALGLERVVTYRTVGVPGAPAPARSHLCEHDCAEGAVGGPRCEGPCAVLGLHPMDEVAPGVKTCEGGQKK